MNARQMKGYEGSRAGKERFALRKIRLQLETRVEMVGSSSSSVVVERNDERGKTRPSQPDLDQRT